MKRADAAFSRYIRLRDADSEGMVRCVTCGARRHWREVDAGHFITRAKQSTRYDEKNVHAQCKGCNRFQGGKPLEHERAIERKYGSGTAHRLKAKAFQTCRRSAADFAFLESLYKQKVSEIEHGR